jgi:S1-C subfamily serine protease
MWLRNEDLLGLVIGLVLGGVALYLFFPRIEAAMLPVPLPVQLAQPAAQPAAPGVVPARPVAQLVVPPPPALGVTAPAPAPLPSIAYHDLAPISPGARPLPAVIGPTQPPKSLGTAGTGFFIASDGSLLTAAHVVTECTRTAIISSFVKPTAAEIVASDARLDIALLRAPHLRPPGILPLGLPPGQPASRQLVVLGYPASAGPIIPAETWATLENDKFPKGAGTLTDPLEIIWIEAAAVTHGFSGGPILDPGNGSVVGLVRATVADDRLRLIRGMPTSGVAVGPGAGRLSNFLRQEAPYLDTVQPTDTGTAAIEDARRATVHVLCWH